jgi:adenosylmethionine-8-amino-7-oxononanoate aminotransferase
MLRITADTIAMSPPLIVSEAQIDEIFAERLPKVLASVEKLS